MEVRIRFEQEIGHPNGEKDAARVTERRQRLSRPPRESSP
jgi:hypothetical protein